MTLFCPCKCCGKQRKEQKVGKFIDCHCSFSLFMQLTCVRASFFFYLLESFHADRSLFCFPRDLRPQTAQPVTKTVAPQQTVFVFCFFLSGFNQVCVWCTSTNKNIDYQENSSIKKKNVSIEPLHANRHLISSSVLFIYFKISPYCM